MDRVVRVAVVAVVAGATLVSVPVVVGANPAPSVNPATSGRAAAPTPQIQPDITAPEVLPTPRVTAVLTSTRVTLSWNSASETATYDVRARSIGVPGRSGAYRIIGSGLIGRTASVNGVAGATLCASVRARDNAGNLSSWSPDGCATVTLDDRSLVARGFSKVRDRTAFASTLSRATTRGSTLRSARLVARSIGVVVRTCPGCGSLTVAWNGKTIRTLNTSGRSGVKVVSVASFRRPATGVVNIAVSSRKGAVTVDGIVVGNAGLTGAVVLNARRGWTNSLMVPVSGVAPGSVKWRLAPEGGTYGAWRALGAADVALPDLDGVRSVSAQFLDAAGNVSPAATAVVVLDRVAPKITVTSGSARIAAGGSTAVSATVEDTSPLQSVLAATRLSDPPHTIGSQELLPSGASFAATISPRAALSYRVSVVDAAGNIASSPDAAVPAITIEVDAPPTAQARIAGDLKAGRIDYATSVLYRLYILFADPRLPESYDGAASTGEDPDLFFELRQAYPTLTTAAREIVDSYLARPDDPASIFGEPPPPPATRQAIGGRLAHATAPPTARDCGAGWRFTDGTHVRVHSCEVDSADRLKVQGILEDLWTPMTVAPSAGMGPPINDGKDNQGTDLDGRLDVYLLNATDCIERAQECIPITGNTVAKAIPTTPFVADGPRTTCAGYLLLSKARIGSPSIKADIVHEFFHVLQYAHNLNAVRIPDGTMKDATGSDIQRFQHSWFSESSAEWASWYYARTEGRTELYNRYGASDGFQRDPKPLITFDGLAPYNSWIWSEFMTEKTPSAVFDAWVGAHSVATPIAFDDVVSAQRSITTDFRDFAVRNVNEVLQGTPFAPWSSLPDFADFPAAPDAVQDPRNQFSLTQGNSLQPVDVPGVSAQYDLIVVPAAVSGAVTLDFSGLENTANLDVDLLLERRSDSEWQRERLDGLSYTFCNLQPDQDFDQVRVVLSNHNYARQSNLLPGADVPDPAQRVSGLYRTSVAPCSALTGTITYQFNHSGAYLNGTSTLQESGALHLALDQPDGGGGPVPFAFVDNGKSRYSISHTETFVHQEGDCEVTDVIKVQDSGPFDMSGLKNVFVTAYTLADPFSPGPSAELTVDLRLPSKVVSTSVGPGCGDPITTDSVALVPWKIQCVPAAMPPLSVMGQPQFVGKRTPDTGTVTGYDFKCTGNTKRDQISPTGSISVAGTLKLATPP